MKGLIGALFVFGYSLIILILSLFYGLDNTTIFSNIYKGVIGLFMSYIIVRSSLTRLDHFWFVTLTFLLVLLFVLSLYVDLILDRFILYKPDLMLLYIIFHIIIPVRFFLVYSEKDLLSFTNNSIFLLGVFSAMVAFKYGHLLGAVSRFGDSATTKLLGHNEIISPLVLAYQGLCLLVLLLAKKSFARRFPILMIFLVFVGFLTFALGASRGALLGILIALFLNLFFRRRYRYLAIFISFSAIVLVTVDMSVIMRLMSTINTDNSENLRVLLLIEGWKEFISNPIGGGALFSQSERHFYHNIWIEILSSTGILGTLCLVCIVILSGINMRKMFRSEYNYIVILWVVFCVHAIFNGTIYLIWSFWSFSALMLFKGARGSYE